MTSPSLRDPRLVELYRRTPGAVAFVDESYRERPFGNERPFYSMSAVTFSREQLDQVREVLTDIAGGRYWHTTEANEYGRGEDIARMGRFLARESQWNVVTVETTVQDVPNGLGRARSTCLAAVAREVQRGAGPNAVRLIVADRNRDEHVNEADRRTMDRLREAGDIDRHVGLYHGRMGQEPVLWAADQVSWSVYRNLAVDDGRWIEPLRDVLTVLDARTGTAVDMKQPQAAAATGALAPSPGAQQPVASKRGEVAVASEASVPGGVHERPAVAPTYRHGTTVLDDLARRIATIRAGAGAGGIANGNTPQALAARVQRLHESRARPQAKDLPQPAPAPGRHL